MTKKHEGKLLMVTLLVNLCFSAKEIAEYMDMRYNTTLQYLHRHKLKVHRNRYGKNNPNWQGGKNKITPYGHIKVFASEHPDADRRGMIFEHRLVMEKKLGRRLTRDEVVHHIDYNPANNAPDNLMLFPSQKAHVHYENVLCRHPNNWRNKKIEEDPIPF